MTVSISEGEKTVPCRMTSMGIRYRQRLMSYFNDEPLRNQEIRESRFIRMDRKKRFIHQRQRRIIREDNVG